MRVLRRINHVKLAALPPRILPYYIHSLTLQIPSSLVDSLLLEGSSQTAYST